MFFILFIVWGFIVIVFSHFKWAGTVQFLRIVKGILIFGVTYHFLNYIHDLTMIKRSLKILAIVSVGISLFAMFQVFTYYMWGIEWPSLLTHDPFGNRLIIPKVSAIFSGHRKLGLISGLFFPYFLYEFFIFKNKVALIWSAVLVFGIIVSYSRIGYLSILITLGVSLLIYIINRRNLKFLVISGILMVVTLPLVVTLLYKFNPISTHRYLNLWRLDIKYFLESPFMGKGFGYFLKATGGHIPHSGVFDILIGTGIIGLIFYSIPFLDTLIKLFKASRGIPDDVMGKFLLFNLSSQMMIILFSFFIIEMNYYLLTYVVLGLGASYISVQDKLQSKQL